MKPSAVLLGLALLLCHAFAFAQGWPGKTVRLIVSTGGGTSPDRIGRIVADRLSRDWGQSVVVDNITGAGGLIASRTAAHAAPDGYTLFFAGVSALVTDLFTIKDMGYDPDRDYEPVAMIYEEGSLALAVHPSLPVRNMAELFAMAKKEPGKISYGTTSVNFIILFGRWLNKLAGTDMLAVAYKAPAQQFQDVLDGRINMIISSPPTVDALMKAGKLRVLAVDGSKRFPLWPDVPNISETFPGFRLSGTGLLAAPRGTPEPVIRAANSAFESNGMGYATEVAAFGAAFDTADRIEGTTAFLEKRAPRFQGK